MTLKELGKEKGIDEEVLFEAIEAALISAYKRNFGSAQNVRVTLSRETGHYHVYAIKTVVEDPEDEITEISLAQARTIKPDYEIGDVIDSVNAIVATIASAVTQQSAATEEIAKNIEQASQGLQEVNENVSQSSVVAASIAQDIIKVNNASGEISSSSERIRENAEQMLDMAGDLNRLVGSFKI